MTNNRRKSTLKILWSLGLFFLTLQVCVQMDDDEKFLV